MTRGELTDLVGRTVAGRYEVLELIARGGNGTVFKARQTLLDRTVALKIVDPSGDPEWRARFVREARAMASLHHPNLLVVFDSGTDDETLGGASYVAMEYIDGPSLRRLLADGRALPLPEVLRIAEQVGSALGYVHRQALVHRDIKPSNILISSKDGRAVVADLGLVLPRGAEGLTQTGMLLGSVAYMAPEQIRGETADPRSDIFAFGAVLYEALTGGRPFEGEKVETVLLKILREEPTPPRNLNPTLPSEVNGVLLKALAKSRDERYATIDDLVAALRTAAGVEPAAFEPRSVPDRSTSGLPLESAVERTEAGPPEPFARGRVASLGSARFILGLVSGAAVLLGVVGWLGVHSMSWSQVPNPVLWAFLAVVGAVVLFLAMSRFLPSAYHKPSPDLQPPPPAQQPSAADASPDETTMAVSPQALVDVLEPVASAMAWVYVQSGPQVGQQFQLGDSVTIGRGAECDVVLEDAGASRLHARINLAEGLYNIEDGGTTNGTYVNGEAVVRQELHDRDEVRIGNTILRFILAVGPEDLTPDARRRVREFDEVWERLMTSVEADG